MIWDIIRKDGKKSIKFAWETKIIEEKKTRGITADRK